MANKAYKKTYLGDGVYVEFREDANDVKLTTSDGTRDTNTIYLGRDETVALVAWLGKLADAFEGL